MIVYVLMEQWCNGHESGESLMDIYATENLAIYAQIAAEHVNTDTEISYRIDERKLISD